MSEQTRCNRCTLDRIERDAMKRGATVKVEREAEQDWWLSVRVSDEPEPVALFMQLSRTCVC